MTLRISHFYRVMIILLAYALASMASGVAGTLTTLIWDQLRAYPQFFLSSHGRVEDLLVAATIGSFLSAVCAIPTALVTIIHSEWRGVTAPLYYAIAGLIAGAVGWVLFSANLGGYSWPPVPSFEENLPLLPAVFSGGLAGGLTYWLIAGRKAGMVRSGSPAA